MNSGKDFSKIERQTNKKINNNRKRKHSGFAGLPHTSAHCGQSFYALPMLQGFPLVSSLCLWTCVVGWFASLNCLECVNVCDCALCWVGSLLRVASTLRPESPGIDSRLTATLCRIISIIKKNNKTFFSQRCIDKVVGIYLIITVSMTHVRLKNTDAF